MRYLILLGIIATLLLTGCTEQSTVKTVNDGPVDKVSTGHPLQ